MGAGPRITGHTRIDLGAVDLTYTSGQVALLQGHAVRGVRCKRVQPIS